MAFFSLLAKKISGFLVFWLKKSLIDHKILLKLWLIGNRTSCCPIRSVIILVIRQIGFRLCGRPILLITCMITDRIGLHSVLLPFYCCHDVTSMKVTSMKYEKFNIKFFVSFRNWLVLLSQMYVTWSNKKASLLCFVLSLDNSCERKKNFFKFHGRYVTSMAIVLAVTDFSEKM